uniref:Fibronectin type-III domain-containing protein n=1 Tax=Soboliphyme baturini TaxID=241478 RepID=A0A183JA23_9BILA
LPESPSQLQVIYVDSTSCTLIWSSAPPPSSRISYIVQYREIGNPTWFMANDEPLYTAQYTVEGLRANSTYEFRVFAQNAYGISQSYVLSEIVQLRPTGKGSAAAGVPPRPNRPDVTDSLNNSVTLRWDPVMSSVSVQGFQVEYCVPNDSPQRWTRVNSILTKNNSMTIGDLIPGQEYQFRVTAKNSIGYSRPSEPSLPISVLEPGVRDTSTLPVEISETRESPPITDTDDSPPPLRRFSPNANEVQYRDPTLPEVIDYLGNANNIIKLNASGYLQHLTFNDDSIKQKVRALGGIEKLVALLNSEVPEIQRNACGCLRNLSFGHPENKLCVLDCNGVEALGSLLKRTPDVQVVEEELKPQVYLHAVDHLIKQIVIPYSGWSASAAPFGSGSISSVSHRTLTNPPLVFRNAVGILRNVSSADDMIRRALHEKPHLIDAVIYFFYGACHRQDFDSKTVENAVCLLRNLSYR